jgi:hypothetical protein
VWSELNEKSLDVSGHSSFSSSTGGSDFSKHAFRKASGELSEAEYANRSASGESLPEDFAMIKASSCSILLREKLATLLTGSNALADVDRLKVDVVDGDH